MEATLVVVGLGQKITAGAFNITDQVGSFLFEDQFEGMALTTQSGSEIFELSLDSVDGDLRRKRRGVSGKRDTLLGEPLDANPVYAQVEWSSRWHGFQWNFRCASKALKLLVPVAERCAGTIVSSLNALVVEPATRPHIADIVCMAR